VKDWEGMVSICIFWLIMFTGAIKLALVYMSWLPIILLSIMLDDMSRPIMFVYDF